MGASCCFSWLRGLGKPRGAPASSRCIIGRLLGLPKTFGRASALLDILAPLLAVPLAGGLAEKTAVPLQFAAKTFEAGLRVKLIYEEEQQFKALSAQAADRQIWTSRPLHWRAQLASRMCPRS